MSRREDLVTAVVATLEAAKPVGVTVHRMRTRALADDQLPAVVVYLVAEEVRRGDGPRGYKNIRSLSLRTELRMVVPPGQVPDEAIDALVTYVERAMMADESQGGRALRTQETMVQWAADDENASRIAAAYVDFTMDYLTAAGDPDVA